MQREEGVGKGGGAKAEEAHLLAWSAAMGRLGWYSSEGSGNLLTSWRLLLRVQLLLLDRLQLLGRLPPVRINICLQSLQRVSQLLRGSLRSPPLRGLRLALSGCLQRGLLQLRRAGTHGGQCLFGLLSLGFGEIELVAGRLVALLGETALYVCHAPLPQREHGQN
jgi:hypothetical protein